MKRKLGSYRPFRCGILRSKSGTTPTSQKSSMPTPVPSPQVKKGTKKVISVDLPYQLDDFYAEMDVLGS